MFSENSIQNSFDSCFRKTRFEKQTPFCVENTQIFRRFDHPQIFRREVVFEIWYLVSPKGLSIRCLRWKQKTPCFYWRFHIGWFPVLIENAPYMRMQSPRCLRFVFYIYYKVRARARMYIRIRVIVKATVISIRVSGLFQIIPIQLPIKPSAQSSL
jgi:hypothetical protein